MLEKNSAWRSPWVIAWVVLVLVVLAVNILMIYLAIDANPGLVVDDYYERGQDYEDNLMKRLAKDPGWKMRIQPPQQVGVATPSIFRFTVEDKQGRPVTPDQVMFYSYRPADSGRDFALPMERVGPGAYRVDVRFPLKGVWDILISVTRGEDEFNTAHRVSAGVVNTP